MNAAEHLQECIWTHPADYGGFSPDGDFCILTINRDSSLLEQSNWDQACRELGAEFYAPERPYYGADADDFPDRPHTYIFRAGHWACGWVEYLMIRHDAPQSILESAGGIVCSLADYPVLDEQDYSDRQYDAALESWRFLSLRERIELCAVAKESIFAARRNDAFPLDSAGYILERLAGE